MYENIYISKAAGDVGGPFHFPSTILNLRSLLRSFRFKTFPIYKHNNMLYTNDIGEYHVTNLLLKSISYTPKVHLRRGVRGESGQK